MAFEDHAAANRPHDDFAFVIHAPGMVAAELVAADELGSFSTPLKSVNFVSVQQCAYQVKEGSDVFGTVDCLVSGSLMGREGKLLCAMAGMAMLTAPAKLA